MARVRVRAWVGGRAGARGRGRVRPWSPRAQPARAPRLVRIRGRVRGRGRVRVRARVRGRVTVRGRGRVPLRQLGG